MAVQTRPRFPNTYCVWAGSMIRTLWLIALTVVIAGQAGCVQPQADTTGQTLPPGDYIHATVERVYDGDTFEAITRHGVRIRVRLAEIDTPEKGEPFSNRARETLLRMVDHDEVAIRLFDIDKYGRIVGRVFANGTDTSAELVRLGLAAVYRRYAKDPQLYELEAEARKAGRGFWPT
ncbi:MAG TPA: hypothetical protein ENK16_05995, partial [Chromatiales bacterium]|nr:hypothetical protein [Chromatiales bacterium]